MIDIAYAVHCLGEFFLLMVLALLVMFGVAALWDLYNSGPGSLAEAGTTRGGAAGEGQPAARHYQHPVFDIEVTR